MRDGIFGCERRRVEEEAGDICKRSVKLAGVIRASINNLFKLNNEGWGLDG